MTTLYAQPYDIAACGFYFDSIDTYTSQAERLRNDYGQPVEEFEIQFIDGDLLDCELFNALGVHQANIEGYFEAVEDWSERQKITVIIAVGEAGYDFDLGKDDPDKFEVDLYEVDSLRDLAIQFVEDGFYGDIPKPIENYLDYDAIGRDLGMDFGTITVNSTRFAYRVS